MARKQGKSGKGKALRSLRAYALAGDFKQAEQVLLRLLEEDPDDTFAEAELKRLRAGAPLRITETKEQRLRREEQEQLNEVLQALSEFKNKELDCRLLDESRLKRYAETAEKLPAQEHLMSFRHTLETELLRRKSRRVRVIAGMGLGIVAALGIITTGVCRHSSAIGKSEALDQALRSGNWSLIQSRLKEAKQPFDRLLSMQLRNSIDQANIWMDSQHAQRDELLRQLARWQSNPQEFAALTGEQRLQFEHRLTSLAYPHQDMQNAWRGLNERLKQAILARSSSVIAVLAKPLPPQPPPTASPEADARALTAYRDELLKRVRFFEEASAIHTLSEELIAPARQALHQAELSLHDIAGLTSLVRNLRQAQSYAHYRSLIGEFKPTQYAPAMHLVAPLSKLPPVQDLQQIVRDGGSSVAHQMLESTLLQAGPTFTAEIPATREQTAIIEHIFTSEPLHRVFFKLNNSKGETCITEKDPVVFSQTKGYQDAKIIRSTYDPAYSPSKPAGFIWTEAETIMKTTIDATPLMRATGIERETFFERANLPTLLDTIISTDAPYCPPLARAYLFHAVLQLILKHPVPEVTGINFCPTLQADTRSFLSIIRRSRRSFEDGMWLREGADIDWLNETYGRWFRERKGKSYAREIAENVQELIDVRPKFAGHIDLKGDVIANPRMATRLKPGTRIWYLRLPKAAEAAGGTASLSIGTFGSPLSKPLPLSPFFIEEKE